MTNKEYQKIKVTCLLICSLFLGLIIGTIVTQIRINAEIRTDQLELKEQIAEIVEDEQVIQDLATELLSQIEQTKAERKALEELKIILSKGE